MRVTYLTFFPHVSTIKTSHKLCAIQLVLGFLFCNTATKSLHSQFGSLGSFLKILQVNLV